MIMTLNVIIITIMLRNMIESMNVIVIMKYDYE